TNRPAAGRCCPPGAGCGLRTTATTCPGPGPAGPVTPVHQVREGPVALEDSWKASGGAITLARPEAHWQCSPPTPRASSAPHRCSRTPSPSQEARERSLLPWARSACASTCPSWGEESVENARPARRLLSTKRLTGGRFLRIVLGGFK